jgi:hypothetical protein
MKALEGDKKKKNGKLQFVVPALHGVKFAEPGEAFSGSKNSFNKELILKIINGEYPL